MIEGKIKEYGVERKNSYNMDEKGFLIRYLKKMRWVYSKLAFNNSKTKQVVQDGNREWITILVSIYADRTVLSPSLIYQAASGYIQDI
jgi:hypothetical protein